MKRLLFSVVAVCACSNSEPKPKAHPAPPAESGKHEDRNEPAIATPPLKLEVRVDGNATTWAQDVFDRVSHHTGTNNSGQMRDTWSLRDMAHEMAGPNARVVTVIGATKEMITAEAWADTTHTPIVHRTRRGGLKFRWTDATGAWDASKVNEVVGLEIVH